MDQLAHFATSLPQLPSIPNAIAAAAIAAALKVDADDAPPTLVPASAAHTSSSSSLSSSSVKEEKETKTEKRQTRRSSSNGHAAKDKEKEKEKDNKDDDTNGNGNGSNDNTDDTNGDGIEHRAPGKISGKKPPAMVTIGAKNNVIFGKGIVLMPDSTDLYTAGRYDEVRKRLETDGFILVRGVVPTDTIAGGRAAIVGHLKSKGVIKKSGNSDAAMKDDKESRKGWTVDAESGGVVADRDPDEDGHVGWAKVGNAKAVTDVYNGAAIQTFYQNVFGSKLLTDGGRVKPLPNCTWLRMKGAGELTIEHCDYFYFKGNTNIFWENRDASLVALDQRKEDDVAATMCKVCGDSKDEDQTVLCDLCSDPYHFYCLKPALKGLPEGEWHCPQCCNSPFDVYTCWTAMGDVTYTDGTLCMFPGSHKLLGYERPIDNELPRSWDKEGKRVIWQTCEMGPGDVVMFNIKTIHAATKNTSSRFRISCDSRVAASRFLPAKEDLRGPGIRKPDDNSADPLDDDEAIVRKKDRALHQRMSMGMSGTKRGKKKKDDDEDHIPDEEDAGEKKRGGRKKAKKAESDDEEHDDDEAVAAVAASTKPKERRTSAARRAAAAAEENKAEEAKAASEPAKPKPKRGGSGKKKEKKESKSEKKESKDASATASSSSSDKKEFVPLVTAASSPAEIALATGLAGIGLAPTAVPAPLLPSLANPAALAVVAPGPYIPFPYTYPPPKKDGRGGARKGAGKKKGSTKGNPAKPKDKKQSGKKRVRDEGTDAVAHGELIKDASIAAVMAAVAASASTRADQQHQHQQQQHAAAAITQQVANAAAAAAAAAIAMAHGISNTPPTILPAAAIKKDDHEPKRAKTDAADGVTKE